MDITTELEGNILIARLAGELDIETVQAFREKVVPETERPGVKTLILNLNKVSFIDSTKMVLWAGIDFWRRKAARFFWLV